MFAREGGDSLGRLIPRIHIIAYTKVYGIYQTATPNNPYVFFNLYHFLSYNLKGNFSGPGQFLKQPFTVCGMDVRYAYGHI